MKLQLKTVSIEKIGDEWQIDADKAFNGTGAMMARSKSLYSIMKLAISIAREDEQRIREWAEGESDEL